MARASRRWLRLLWKSLAWIIAVVLALVLILVALGAYGRWRGPDAQGRAALVLMQAPQMQPAGNNAFPIVWLWRWPVPDAQLQAVTDADMARLRRLVEGPTHNPDWSMFRRDTAARMAPFDFQTEAQRRWPAAAGADFLSLCPIVNHWAPLHCIAFVQAHPARVAAALAASRTVLHRAAQLQHTQYLWSALPATPALPSEVIPAAVSLAQTALTADAQRFLAGDTRAALTDACRSALTWRRLYGHSNTLLFAAEAQRNVGASLQLMAAMLARLSATAPIPPQCLQATAPLAARAVDLCAAGRRGFEKHVLFYKEMASTAATSLGQRLIQWLVFDPRLDSAYYARLYAPLCQPGYVARVLADPQAFAGMPLPRLGLTGALGSPVTEITAAGEREIPADLALLAANLGAHIRLAAAVLALHRQATVPGLALAARYAALPAALRGIHHPVGVTANGRALYVRDLGTSGFLGRFALSVVAPAPLAASPARPDTHPASPPAPPQRSR